MLIFNNFVFLIFDAHKSQIQGHGMIISLVQQLLIFDIRCYNQFIICDTQN